MSMSYEMDATKKSVRWAWRRISSVVVHLVVNRMSLTVVRTVTPNQVLSDQRPAMAGPNLEVFKFAVYVFFPVLVFLHYGDPEWHRTNVIPVRTFRASLGRASDDHRFGCSV